MEYLKGRIKMKLTFTAILIFLIVFSIASFVNSKPQCIIFDGTKPPTSKSMVLSIDRSGVYVVEGSVNGISTHFIIDTGASYTTLSAEMAQQLGLTDCTHSKPVESANGQVRSCGAHVDSLVVGKFEADNMDIQYIKSMGDISVIGNDFLSHFHISLFDNKMIISI